MMNHSDSLNFLLKLPSPLHTGHMGVIPVTSFTTDWIQNDMYGKGHCKNIAWELFDNIGNYMLCPEKNEAIDICSSKWFLLAVMKAKHRWAQVVCVIYFSLQKNLKKNLS